MLKYRMSHNKLIAKLMLYDERNHS